MMRCASSDSGDLGALKMVLLVAVVCCRIAITSVGRATNRPGTSRDFVISAAVGHACRRNNTTTLTMMPP